MFRFLVGLLILLGLAFLADSLTEGQELLAVVSRGVPFWVAAAVLSEGLMRGSQALLLRSVFQLFEVRFGIGRAVQLLLVQMFTSVAAPGGSLSGTAVVIAACVRRGVDPGRATIASFVYFLLDYVAFCLILAGAIIFLAQGHRLYPYELWAAVLLALLVSGMVLILAVAVFRPEFLTLQAGRFEARLAGGRWRRRWRFAATAAAGGGLGVRVGELVGTVRRLRTHRHELARPICFALGIHLASVLTLAAIFLAFQHPVPATILVAGYAVGRLFTIVSITPSGIGFVEGAMTGAFVSLGIPIETAVVVVLVYRGITVWLPFLVGAWGVRALARP